MDAGDAGADFVILVGHLGENPPFKEWSSLNVAAHTRGIDAIIDGHRFEGVRMTRSDFITDTDALAHYIKSLSSIPETYREPQGQGRIKVIGK